MATTTEPATSARLETSPSEVPDAVLVRRCLDGDEAAWAIIVSRYKRLIYSIPLKYGATHDAACDIFQSVCVELVTELPKLRKPEALKGWLVSVTQHKALKAKQRARREVEWVGADTVADVTVDADPNAAQLIEGAQRDQLIREAVADLPDRCQALVRMLFFTDTPVPYAEVAARLGLAVGSIGFIRGRCLKKLEAALKTRGM